jgi:V8-like Glu-specific endopeptidase
MARKPSPAGSAQASDSGVTDTAVAPATYSTSTYPYDDVVYIQDNLDGGVRFSGFVVGPHTILTVSHGLWDSATSQSASAIEVFPGYSGSTNPVGSTTPVPGAWVDHYFEINDNDGGPDLETRADSSQDFAIIDFTNYTFSSWFGISTGYPGGTVNVTGYPGDAGHTQTSETGTVSADGAYPVLDYGSVAPAPGNSGSPIWINNGTSADPLPDAVGVVSTSGWGVQLTNSDLQTILSWEASDGVSTTPQPTQAPTPSSTNNYVSNSRLVTPGSGKTNYYGTSDRLVANAGSERLNLLGGNDTIAAGFVSGKSTDRIALGANNVFSEGPGGFADTVVGFNEASGDRIHLTNETVHQVVAHSSWLIDGGQDTEIAFADGSTLILKGITDLTRSFFS